MPGLLDLPFEVRLIIIRLVIYAESEHPTQYSEDSGRKERTEDFLRSWERTAVWYETDPKAYVTSAHGLLGANKQLYQETTTLLTKSPTVYKIDVGLMQGRMLWPTWTSLTRKTNNVDLIEATIQARGPGKPCLECWRHGNAAPPRFVWWFYSLLERFYRYGVQGPPKDSKPARNALDIDWSSEDQQSQKSLHVIRVLDLNCIEPDESYEEPEPEMDMFERWARDVNDTLPDDCIHCGKACYTLLRRSLDLRAAALNDRLSGEIHGLLRMRSTMPWAKLLFYTIGKIRFRVNGHLRSEIDLNDWLVKLPDLWERQDISEWRKQAIRFKKARGFVLPDDVQQYPDYPGLWQEMLDSLARAQKPSENEAQNNEKEVDDLA